jgi:Tol biopolymer transport system component
VPVAGGSAVPLTDDPGNEYDPRWSPDGGEIAFSGHRPGAGGGGSEVSVVPVAGGSPVTITSGPGSASCPAWSPDGLRIAFCSDRTGRSEVWIATRDSIGGPWKDVARLTDFGAEPVDWAPDGSGVLVRSGESLVLVTLGGRVRWRRNLATTTGLAIGGVRLARDGRTVFGEGDHTNGRRGIWAIPVPMGEPRLVVQIDDASLITMGFLSVARDRLYVVVAQPESDIWVANLRW